MLNCGVSIFTLLPPAPKMLARFPPAFLTGTCATGGAGGGGGGGRGDGVGGGGGGGCCSVEHSLHQKMFSQTSLHCCVGVLEHSVRGTSSTILFTSFQFSPFKFLHQIMLGMISRNKNDLKHFLATLLRHGQTFLSIIIIIS